MGTGAGHTGPRFRWLGMMAWMFGRHSRRLFGALLLVLAPRLFAASPGEQPIVGMITREYSDAGRLNWARTGPRPIRTAIWYPVDGVTEKETIFGGPEAERVFVPVDVAPAAPLSARSKKYPIIVLSHGTGGSALMMMWLGTYLAARGYIVAAVNHHGNTAAEKELVPQAFLLYWERHSMRFCTIGCSRGESTREESEPRDSHWVAIRSSLPPEDGSISGNSTRSARRPHAISLAARRMNSPRLPHDSLLFGTRIPSSVNHCVARAPRIAMEKSGLCSRSRLRSAADSRSAIFAASRFR
jgi:hypothetical protein